MKRLITLGREFYLRENKTKFEYTEGWHVTVSGFKSQKEAEEFIKEIEK